MSYRTSSTTVNFVALCCRINDEAVIFSTFCVCAEENEHTYFTTSAISVTTGGNCRRLQLVSYY